MHCHNQRATPLLLRCGAARQAEHGRLSKELAARKAELERLRGEHRDTEALLRKARKRAQQVRRSAGWLACRPGGSLGGQACGAAREGARSRSGVGAGLRTGITTCALAPVLVPS